MPPSSADPAGLAAEPMRPRYRFWTRENLRNADTDLQGHVNNAVVGTLFEAGRIEALDGPPIRAIREHTLIVVARLLVEYRQELFFPGFVEVGSRVPKIGRSSVLFEQVVVASNGTTATAEATCVLLDRATRRPIAVPDDMRRYLMGTD